MEVDKLKDKTWYVLTVDYGSLKAGSKGYYDKDDPNIGGFANNLLKWENFENGHSGKGSDGSKCYYFVELKLLKEESSESINKSIDMKDRVIGEVYHYSNSNWTSDYIEIYKHTDNRYYSIYKSKNDTSGWRLHVVFFSCYCSGGQVRKATKEEKQELYRIVKETKGVDLNPVKRNVVQESEWVPKVGDWVKWTGIHPIVAKIIRQDGGIDCYVLDEKTHNSCHISNLRKAEPHEIPKENSIEEIILEEGKWYQFTSYRYTFENICKYTKGSSYFTASKWYLRNNKMGRGAWDKQDISDLKLADMEEVYKHFPEEKPNKSESITVDELVAEAKRRYPIGTKFKCAYYDDIYTLKEISDSEGKSGWYTENHIIAWIEESGASGRYLYYKGKWADIIETPKSKSLVGRYVKALVDNPLFINMEAGDYAIFTSENILRVIKTDTDGWGYHDKTPEVMELMPEGFIPPTPIQSPEEFVLPDSWFIRTNKDIDYILTGWRGGGYTKNNPKDEIVLRYSRETDSKYWTNVKSLNGNEVEITFEQFKKYVLKDESSSKLDHTVKITNSDGQKYVYEALNIDYGDQVEDSSKVFKEPALIQVKNNKKKQSKFLIFNK